MDEGYEVTYVRARKHGFMTVFVLSANYVTQLVTETADFMGQLTEVAAQHREHMIETEQFEEVIGGFDGDAS